MHAWLRAPKTADVDSYQCSACFLWIHVTGMQLASDIVAAGLAPDVGAAVASVVEQTPLGRLGEVGDMADAAVFLCSNEARFITGAGLPVDGGMGM